MVELSVLDSGRVDHGVNLNEVDFGDVNLDGESRAEVDSVEFSDGLFHGLNSEGVSVFALFPGKVGRVSDGLS
jgi:hypothetical protein